MRLSVFRCPGPSPVVTCYRRISSLTILLATASSDAVLAQIMKKLERLGVKKSVVGLVVPTGYSFNFDAFSIYLTLAVVFIAQATNTPLSLGDLLLVLGVSLVTSKGAHGVRGSAIVIPAATLNAVPSIPAIGLVTQGDPPALPGWQ
jgi:aerobic C4-dicarboxylate transport protein